MRISEKEREILTYVQYHAEQTVKMVAKKTGYRETEVRYTIQKALENNLIVRYPLVNRLALGLNDYNIFFSMAQGSSKWKAELRDYLIKSRVVLWLAEMGTDLPYGLDISARNLFEVRDFLHLLSKRFNQVFSHKLISTQLSVIKYGTRFLTKEDLGLKIGIRVPVDKEVEIDELDTLILSAVSNIPHRSERELSLKIGLAPTTFEYRMKRLREASVFLGYRYAINTRLLGCQSYKLFLYGAGLSSNLAKSVRSFCDRNLNVSAYYECIGSWDYEINLEVPNSDDVVAIIEKLYEACGPDLQSIKALQRFRDLKLLSYPTFDRYDLVGLEEAHASLGFLFKHD